VYDAPAEIDLEVIIENSVRLPPVCYVSDLFFVPEEIAAADLLLVIQIAHRLSRVPVGYDLHVGWKRVVSECVIAMVVRVDEVLDRAVRELTRDPL
jgi:hypothetical protein